MRIAAYAGTSAALAVAVILRAFHQRPNFYSASVYLSQSNACLMVLTNLLLLCTGALLYAMQRFFYGPLRPIETEQLYEKGWFAVTETCLAMTMFREEIGGWFLIMFVGLIAGRIWVWIGEGRVEFLEQQPPANPGLFHLRLTVSLLLSVVFDTFMLNYCTSIVLEEARPGMMVMFAFEFAVLALSSCSTAIRYVISLNEIVLVKQQTKARLEARKAEVRTARERAEQSGGDLTNLPREEDIDENDIDVPGWEDKGRWIFYLELATDLFKLLVYLGFFAIITTFHGLPIHIMRDVFMTARSFVKRIYDFIRYRAATRDMNTRYPDATAEELNRESTCIICREDMRPWQPQQGPQPAGGDAQQVPQLEERVRPKKLPCGHVLHFGCLRSWLERQQVCPTCRRPVLVNNPPVIATPAGQRNQLNVNQRHQGQAGAQPANPQPGDPLNRNGAPFQPEGMRVYNLGPLRIAFGAWPLNPQQNINAPRPLMPQGAHRQNGAFYQTPGNAGVRAGQAPPFQHMPSSGSNSDEQIMQLRLIDLERRVLQQLQALQTAEDQLNDIRNMQAELARIRALSNGQSTPVDRMQQPYITATSLQHPQQQYMSASSSHQAPESSTIPRFTSTFRSSISSSQTLPQPQQGMPPPAFQPSSQQVPLHANDPALPQGLVIPQGWTLLPLQQVVQPEAGPTHSGPSEVPATSSFAQNASSASSSSFSPVVSSRTTINAANTNSNGVAGSSQQGEQPPTTSTLLQNQQEVST